MSFPLSVPGYQVMTLAHKRPRLFTIYKKSGNFGWKFSVGKTVRIVYYLPKISGLSRRARLGSSYNMKMVRNSRNL